MPPMATPGVGFRFLEAGEQLAPGDEVSVRQGFVREWVPMTHSFHCRIGPADGIVFPAGYYRRKT